MAIGIALNISFRVVREKIFSSTFFFVLVGMVCLLSAKTVIIDLQQFKHYPVESDWAMWILAIEQIAPQHLLTDW